MRRSRGTVPFTAGIALAGLLVGRAQARVCEVAVHVDSAVTLGALQLDLDYSGTGGLVPIENEKIRCKGDVDNALSLFGIENEVVTVSVLSLAGFTTPARIAHCLFDDPDGTTGADDFDLRVTDSTGITGLAVAVGHVSVSYGPCDDDTTTTTTSSTTTTTTTSSTTSTTTTSTSSTSTTTMPESCGNGVVDGDEDCDDGNDEDGDACGVDCTGIVCGDANGNDTIQSSDALLVLRAAIGERVSCPVQLCDVDGDDAVRASDSLRVLKRAVGQSVVMDCGES